jgi:putative transposase
VIEAQKATYTVSRMCALLEVSRSGFYKWRKSRNGGPSPSRQRRAELDAKVADFHQASDGVYGAPRILADLRCAGERVSRKTVAASLRRQGLAGISPRTFAPATTVVDLDAPVPKDLVRRRFDTVSWTGYGPRTSPTCAPDRAGCTCARCVTAVRGG